MLWQFVKPRTCWRFGFGFSVFFVGVKIDVRSRLNEYFQKPKPIGFKFREYFQKSKPNGFRVGSIFLDCQFQILTILILITFLTQVQNERFVFLSFVNKNCCYFKIKKRLLQLFHHLLLFLFLIFFSSIFFSFITSLHLLLPLLVASSLIMHITLGMPLFLFIFCLFLVVVCKTRAKPKKKKRRRRRRQKKKIERNYYFYKKDAKKKLKNKILFFCFCFSPCFSIFLISIYIFFLQDFFKSRRRIVVFYLFNWFVFLFSVS